MRQARGDYPHWADSIGIPILGTILTSLTGAVVTPLLLRGLLAGHRLDGRAIPGRPAGLWGWTRTSILAMWILFLALLLVASIIDGMEGLALVGAPAIVILLTILSASPIRGESDKHKVESEEMEVAEPESPQ